MTDLCLAGGVALNCVGNGRILREGPFEQIWIQPAAGDAGGALGVAMSLWHRHLEKPRISPEAAGTWERPAQQARRQNQGRRQGRDAEVRRRHERLVPRSAVLRSGDCGGDSEGRLGRQACRPAKRGRASGGGHGRRKKSSA